MAWIAAIIAAYIVVYTVINVGFRKEAPPHEPWAEAERRAADARSGRPGLVVQASMMGWSRLVATLEPAPGAPVSTPMAAVTVSPTPGRLDQALPIELVLIVPGKPALHPSIGGVDAPATLRRGEPLRLRLHVADAGTGPAFGEPLVYAKEGRLHIFIQDASRTARDAAPAPAAEFVSLVVALPPEGLAAGPWTGAVYSEASVFTWSFAAE